MIPSVAARHGGPSVALRLMTEGLARAGIEVEVATTADEARRPGSANEAGVAMHYFRRQLGFYTISLPLRRWVNQHAREFDAVHIHAVFSFASTVAAHAAKRASVPCIIRPLGTLAPYGMQQHAALKQISFDRIERPMLEGAAAIHCTSQQEASEIRALGIDTRSVIIPIGLPVSDPAPRDHDWLGRQTRRLADHQVVLFLSRIDPKKDLELLLESFALLRAGRERVALVVAGAGDADYTERLKHLARSLGIRDSVWWAGHLEGEEKQAAWRAADLFVLPSQAENFGIAAVEALAAGVPVVLSDQVGIQEAVARTGAGVIVKREVNELTAAMERLLADDALRLQHAAHARALARSDFSQETMTEHLLELYRSLR